MPKEWRPNRTAIKEANDLNNLSIDVLINKRDNEENKKKKIVLKTSKLKSNEESNFED